MPWNILALLTRVETTQAVLQAARLISQRRADGRLAALHVRHDPMEGFLPSEEIMTQERRQALEAAQAKNAATIKAVYDEWVSCQGEPRPVWQDVTGPVREVVPARAGLADLVVVGHGGGGMDPDAWEAVQALLFEAGALTLLVPASLPGSIGRHAALAWKESRPVERVIEAALPLLMKADRVTVLIGDEAREAGAFPEGIVAVLGDAGVPVDQIRFESGALGIGEALLAKARSCGADLLVMGAFSHSRIREIILGGATRDILHRADKPVLMRH
jgi:nucleotide-binding universal stress UspA family protein